jgi:hypothetical protein
MIVSLSLNRHILSDSPFQTIDNADVVVQHQGVVVNKLSRNEGFYFSSGWKPKIGETYEIVATTESFGSVSSSSFIPAPEKITKVEMIEGPVLSHGEPDNTLRVTFTDTSTEANYYQITVATEDEYYNRELDEIVISRHFIPLDSDDPVIQNAILNQYEGVLLKDILFNGKETTVSLKTSDPFLFQMPADFIITLRTVSEDYYRYKSTYSLQLDTSGDPFAQPVNVYNNIENGFGIFAGFSQSEYHFGRIPGPEITSISPTSGRPGDHVIITGKHFPPMSEYSKPISFNGDQFLYDDRALLVRATETELEVIVPSKAKTGKIVFEYNGTAAVSEVDFEIIP